MAGVLPDRCGGPEMPRPCGEVGICDTRSTSIGSQMSLNSGLMQGKRGVILGVANNRSIAWGIAKACHAAGAEIALTWQGDALQKGVDPLAKELGGILPGHCVGTEPPTLAPAFAVLQAQTGT